MKKAIIVVVLPLWLPLRSRFLYCGEKRAANARARATVRPAKTVSIVSTATRAAPAGENRALFISAFGRGNGRCRCCSPMQVNSATLFDNIA